MLRGEHSDTLPLLNNLSLLIKRRAVLSADEVPFVRSGCIDHPARLLSNCKDVDFGGADVT